MKNLNFLKNFNLQNFKSGRSSIPYMNIHFYKISDYGVKNFSTNTNSANKKINLQDLKEKLQKQGELKLYESKYSFTSEKLLAHSSIIFLIISSSTIFFSQVSTFMKIINFVFLFTPSLLIQIERFINNTRFVETIFILPDGKVKVVNMWGKSEVIPVEDLNTSELDPRVQKQKKHLNNETFIIFTNKNNAALYHVAREGVFLDEDLFYQTLEGKKLF
jgi:hypothetical protein